MIFTVTWSPVALAQLTVIWLAAGDRNAVTRASNRADQLRRVDPQLLGFPLAGGDRIVFVPPIRVVVSINWMDMIARVEEVLGP